MVQSHPFLYKGRLTVFPNMTFKILPVILWIYPILTCLDFICPSYANYLKSLLSSHYFKHPTQILLSPWSFIDPLLPHSCPNILVLWLGSYGKGTLRHVTPATISGNMSGYMAETGVLFYACLPLVIAQTYVVLLCSVHPEDKHIERILYPPLRFCLLLGFHLIIFKKFPSLCWNSSSVHLTFPTRSLNIFSTDLVKSVLIIPTSGRFLGLVLLTISFLGNQPRPLASSHVCWCVIKCQKLHVKERLKLE